MKNNISDDLNFATEILQELKQQSKRWFIAFITVLILWFATIGAFIWYITLPAEDVTIENDEGNANYIGNNLEGDLYNGENTSNKKSDEAQRE